MSAKMRQENAKRKPRRIAMIAGMNGESQVFYWGVLRVIGSYQMARWISSLVIVTALVGTSYAQYRTPQEEQRMRDYLKAHGVDPNEAADPLAAHNQHTGIFSGSTS